MIIPSQTKQQSNEALADTLDNALKKALAEIPLRVIPVVPQGNLKSPSRTEPTQKLTGSLNWLETRLSATRLTR